MFIFIMFEGLEGVGKILVIKKVSERLVKEYDIVIICEFGGVLISEEICCIVFDGDSIDIWIEVMLFVVFRCEYFVEKIILFL